MDRGLDGCFIALGNEIPPIIPAQQVAPLLSVAINPGDAPTDICTHMGISQGAPGRNRHKVLLAGHRAARAAPMTAPIGIACEFNHCLQSHRAAAASENQAPARGFDHIA